MRQYEFHVYQASAEGEVSADPIRVDLLHCIDDRSAKSAARKMAARNRGPIDLAVSGPSPWNDRYLGTASLRWLDGPSKATIFERLD